MQVALVFALARPALGAEPDPRDLVQEARRLIERASTDPDALAEGQRLTRRAAALGAAKSEVLVNESLAALAAGYKRGHSFQDSSYMRGAVARATQLADEAIAVSPGTLAAESQAGLVDLLRGAPEAAALHLARAREADDEALRPWLYEAARCLAADSVLHAWEALAEAEARASTSFDDVRIARLRIQVARRAGDAAVEERLHASLVSRHPESAPDLVAYGEHLVRHRRFVDAQQWFRRALEIESSPEAARGLERIALRLRLQGDPRIAASQPIAER